VKHRYQAHSHKESALSLVQLEERRRRRIPCQCPIWKHRKLMLTFQQVISSSHRTEAAISSRIKHISSVGSGWSHAFSGYLLGSMTPRLCGVRVVNAGETYLIPVNRMFQSDSENRVVDNKYRNSRDDPPGTISAYNSSLRDFTTWNRSCIILAHFFSKLRFVRKPRTEEALLGCSREFIIPEFCQR